MYAGAHAQENAAVEVALNVKVPQVTGNGAEEELQAAVVTDLIQKSEILCTDIFLYGAQMDIQRSLVVTQLCLGADGQWVGMHQLVDLQCRDAAPIQLLRAADDGIFSRGEHLLDFLRGLYHICQLIAIALPRILNTGIGMRQRCPNCQNAQKPKVLFRQFL